MLIHLREQRHLKKCNFYNGAAEAYGWIAYLMESKGDAETALYYYHKSLSLREKMNNKDAMAISLNNIAYIHKHNELRKNSCDFTV